MVDVITASVSLAVGGQENTSQQRSAGKRARASFHDTAGSSNKRRALASLSNHADAITGRQQQNTKAVSD